MKVIKVIGMLLLVAFIASCNKKKEENPEEATVQIENTAKETSKESNLDLSACDRFLNEYEAWMNNYIEVMARHKDNPVGLVGDPEYTKMMSEGIDWATRWMQQPQACMTSSNYSERFDAIQDRAEEKMKELGLK